MRRVVQTSPAANAAGMMLNSAGMDEESEVAWMGWSGWTGCRWCVERERRLDKDEVSVSLCRALGDWRVGVYLVPLIREYDSQT